MVKYIGLPLSSCLFPHFALQYFSDLRNSIVNSQPPEKQQAMHLCFENLMDGIERNLLTKNRDRSVSSVLLRVASRAWSPSRAWPEQGTALGCGVWQR